MSYINQIAADTRRALRRLAKAVVVITCTHEGKRFAMAATAVSELSMEPPSLLICVNRSASLFEPLTQCSHFCVNILHSSHEEISAACGGKIKGEARFQLGRWSTTAHGLPYLEDAQAVFACRNERRVDYGSHGIFMGEIVEVFDQGVVDPLIYVDGRYTVVQATHASA